jgi:hypothetical protein
MCWRLSQTDTNTVFNPVSPRQSDVSGGKNFACMLKLPNMTFRSSYARIKSKPWHPPPGHTSGNLDFDVLVRSNSLHIIVIPVQIHHVLWKIGVQMPHPMYELEATACRNFGITKFFFPSETRASIVQTRFLVTNQGKFLRTLNSSIVIDAILDSAHVFKKNSYSRPLSKFPTFH